jgi:hypothetical protein
MSGAGTTPARHFALPVSGITVTLAPLTGVEDILLAEGHAADPALALALARRTGLGPGSALDWADLPVTDVDYFLLRLREALLGGVISANQNCLAEACGKRMEFSFRIADYLRHHAPKPARGRGWAALPAEEAGWYRLEAAGEMQARFRLPSLGDQIMAQGKEDEAAWLEQVCIQPHGLPARVRARVEAAMECLAPPLSSTLAGTCPDCGARLEAQFEARRFCLTELKDRARFVYDDVDAMAERYHWDEGTILALPQARRVQYAERARQAARGA